MNDLVGVLIIITCAIIVAAWGAWKIGTNDKK
jgi:hypothetical protein